MPQNHVEQVVLARRLESTVTVNLHGAAVTSLVMNGTERLFLSKSTVLDNKAPIRSGIPVILSQDPVHDFFRTSPWTLVEKNKNPSGDVMASFVLEDSEATRKVWDQRFKATFRISLKKKEIVFDLSVENTDSKPFHCAPMIQNHFLVDDVTNTSVLGLQESDSSDEVNYSIPATSGERLSIHGPLDRVYANTATEHVLKNTLDGATLFIRKWNMPDTVIWNPWEDNSANCGQGAHDFTSEEYAEMLCVGCGHVTQSIGLHPGAIFHASQSLSLE